MRGSGVRIPSAPFPAPHENRGMAFAENSEDETNWYDMHLTRHEDGWIYGTFCVEKKDAAKGESDTASALASHDQRRQGRPRCHADQDAGRMAPRRPCGARKCGGAALCALHFSLRPQRAMEGDCPARRIPAGSRGGGAGGRVSDVFFSNGAVASGNGDFFLYYASSDTRLHVATSTVDALLDYTLNTPPDALRSAKCVEQRIGLIRRNQAIP